MMMPTPLYCDLCGRLLSDPDHDARTCAPSTWERRLLRLINQWWLDANEADRIGDAARGSTLQRCIDDVRDEMAEHRRGAAVRQPSVRRKSRPPKLAVAGKPTEDLPQPIDLELPNRPPSGKLHVCSICGKSEVWGPSWTWWGSIVDADAGKECPEFCSRDCAGVFHANGKRAAPAAKSR